MGIIHSFLKFKYDLYENINNVKQFVCHFHSKYTQLYAPIVIEDEDDSDTVECSHDIPEDTG